MAELDELLRDAFARIADDAATAHDPAGVADAIRARVASGDAGAPAPGSTAPGWGGPGAAGWIGVVGVVVAAGVLGAALGVSGLLGRPVATQTVVPDAALAAAAQTHRCVAGEVIGSIPAGTRVLAVARSEDAGWLGVRDPATLTGTLWVEAAVVAPDAGGAWAGLPVGGACPTSDAEPVDPVDPAPAPTEEPGPAPRPDPRPQPQPGDTTAPTVLQASARPTTVYNGESSTLTAVASDDTGVASVVVSWSGASSGSGTMTPSGGQWVFTWPNGTSSYGLVTFTIRASDAAGNLSAPATVVVDHQYFG